jgi:hypothetical protein
VTLDPATEANLADALAAVQKAADEARKAPDLDAMKRTLNRVWFAVHDAQATITQAEAQTRKAALETVNLRSAA